MFKEAGRRKMNGEDGRGARRFMNRLSVLASVSKFRSGA